MQKFLTTLALFAATTFAAVAFAQETAPAAPTFDETATAESLGLEPFAAPDGLFPIFVWDQLDDWGVRYQTPADAISSMAECGCTLSAFVSTPESAELARKSGLYYIYRIPLNIGDPKLTDEKIDEIVAQTVEKTQDDPLLLGYYLRDEPSAKLFPQLAAAVASIKKRAPGKLAYINLYPGYASTIGADVDSQLGTHSYREYLERFVQEVKPQFLSYDNYMIEYSEDGRTESRAAVYFSDLFEVRDVALKYDLPFWFIGSSLCIMKESSPPTLARYAYQAYTPLAAGARGLTWFLYYPLEWTESPIDKNGRKTLSWVYMRDVNEQIKIVGSYLLAYRSTACGVSKLFNDDDLNKFPELPKNVLKNVSASFSTAGKFDEEPKLMIGEFAQIDGENVAALAVNLNFGSSVKIRFELPDGFSKGKVLSPVDGSETEIDVQTLENGFWLLPGHGRLFVFEK